MGSLQIWHWISVLGVVLVLFGGRSRISQLMDDFALGIRAYKEGMSEDDGGPGWRWQDVLHWTFAILVLAGLIIIIQSM